MATITSEVFVEVVIEVERRSKAELQTRMMMDQALFGRHVRDGGGGWTYIRVLQLR